MRTLAATFSSTNEAEAARRRLEAIGISRERIILRDVPAAEGPAGGVFLSVKVTTEQVQPAGEILKERPAAAAEPPVPPRPVPTFEAEPEPALARAAAQPQLQPVAGGSGAAAGDRARRGRYFVYYGFALLAAFIFGAWLGLAG